MNETELMLTTILGCERHQLYVRPPILNPDQKRLLTEMEKRRQGNEPLQYILGSTRFLDFDLKVREGVLIPRPETELLVDAVIKEAKTSSRYPRRILDLGTGCGNIAISLAHYFSESHVTALDISSQAIELALENARVHGVVDRITYKKQCFMEFLNRTFPQEDMFDIIVSNPPYVAEKEMESLPLDVKREPREALAAGPQGFRLIKPIIENAGRALVTGGILAIEFGDGQLPHIKEIFGQAGYYGPINFGRDYTLSPRYVIARKR